MTIKILQGNCIDKLKTIAAKTFHTCVTSPPYWGLRDYGTATWIGGDPNCFHKDAKLKSRYDYSLKTSLLQDGSRTGTHRSKCSPS